MSLRGRLIDNDTIEVDEGLLLVFKDGQAAHVIVDTLRSNWAAPQIERAVREATDLDVQVDTSAWHHERDWSSAPLIRFRENPERNDEKDMAEYRVSTAGSYGTGSPKAFVVEQHIGRRWIQVAGPFRTYSAAVEAIAEAPRIRSLELGVGEVDEKASASLAKVKLRAKYQPGDLSGAVLSAGYYAKKLERTMYVYEGTSYMHVVYRVSDRPSEYLNPINNSGATVVSVTPDLVVSKHDVMRPP